MRAIPTIFGLFDRGDGPQNSGAQFPSTGKLARDIISSFELKPPLDLYTSRGEQFSHLKHQPISRKWGPFRKRFTAAVACFNTAVVGFLIGIYVRTLSIPCFPY